MKLLKRNWFIGVKIVFLITVIVSFFSCQKAQKLSPVRYMKWMSTNHKALEEKKEINGVYYQAEYCPLPYQVIKEFEEISSVTKKSYMVEEEKRNGMQYFTFKIGLSGSKNDIVKHNISKDADYARRIEYLSFYVNEDFKLVDGKDTLDCLMHHFERSYGLSPVITLSLAFNASDMEEGVDNKTIIFSDQLYDGGIVKLRFSKDKFKKLPKILV